MTPGPVEEICAAFDVPVALVQPRRRRTGRCWPAQVWLLREDNYVSEDEDEEIPQGWQQRIRMCARTRKHPGPATDPGPWNERGALIVQPPRTHQYGPVPLPFTHRRRHR